VTTKYVFDIRERDTYWCTRGHRLGDGAHVRGVWPAVERGDHRHVRGCAEFSGLRAFVVDRAAHKVNVFYTAPTAIRAFMRAGREFPDKYSLASLRLLGSVGEPINPEAWMWYYEVIGHAKCPIVDTWWQTETGAIMITPLPGAIPTKPGSATVPFFGVDAAVVDREGRSWGPTRRAAGDPQAVAVDAARDLQTTRIGT